MPPSTPPVRVLVTLDWSAPQSREVLAGIVEAARTQPWRFTDRSGADAVIHDGRTFDIADGRPSVFVSTEDERADVRPDPTAVGASAAAHFLDRGFRHFARPASVPGVAAFDASVRAAGHATPSVIGAEGDVATLPTPLAIYAPDVLAAGLIRCARRAGRRVPEAVAALGVGNDPAVCELADPPLSSIDLGPRSIGRRAAMRLGRLLKRKPVPAVEFVASATVVPRASTDTLAIDDADVVAAVRFMREHAAGPLRVGDVLRATDLDRRTLERRFRRALGRSPAEVLRRHRVATAAGMLRSTRRPVTEIAHATGFRLPQHLAAAFKSITGQTPSDYRASHRNDGN